MVIVLDFSLSPYCVLVHSSCVGSNVLISTLENIK